MKVVLATRNKNKIKELKILLSEFPGGIDVLSLDDIGYYEDTEENGETFIENALIKAKTPNCKDYMVIADDSGLCVPALGDAPGVYSARYSGKDATDKSNNEKLISEMKDLTGEERTAYYVCAAVCVFPDNREPIVCEQRCYGRILCEPRGNGGFGYDPYFFTEEYQKTLAEITLEEKNKISHRAKAFGLLCKKLCEALSEENQ